MMPYKDPEKNRECKKRWAEANPEYKLLYYQDNKEKIINRVKDWREYNKEACVLRNLKHKAKKLGLPFNLTLEDIQNPGICPVTGITMERGPVKEFKTSPSVDRIIPSLGYIKGNVQIISNKANTMKSDATPEELRMFAKWVLKTFPEESDGKT